MRINADKSKIMAFNMSYKYRFPPEVFISPTHMLEEVTCTKILGVIVSNDLKWTQNTDYLTSKAKQRLWTLRKLSKMGFDKNFILDVYTKEVRSLLEYCVPVWNGALTTKEGLQFEKKASKFFEGFS